ncbi:MAG: hypothetical protein ACOY46_14275 [Bacillota bacterium]
MNQMAIPDIMQNTCSILKGDAVMVKVKDETLTKEGKEAALYDGAGC